MKSTVAVVVLSLVASFGSGAQAQGIFSKDFFVNALAKKGTRVARVAEPACTDFGGNWVGSCTFNGGNAQANEIAFQQVGCEGVVVSGVAVPIDGLVTLTSTPSRNAQALGAGSVQLQTAWNASKTELSAKVRMTLPDTGLTDFVTVNATMRMNGAALEMNQTIHVEGQTPDMVYVCSYQKRS
jgi:hypothetical protein